MNVAELCVMYMLSLGDLLMSRTHLYTLYVLVLGSSFSKHYTTTVYIVGDLEEWRRVEGGVGGWRGGWVGGWVVLQPNPHSRRRNVGAKSLHL